MAVIFEALQTIPVLTGTHHDVTVVVPRNKSGFTFALTKQGELRVLSSRSIRPFVNLFNSSASDLRTVAKLLKIPYAEMQLAQKAYDLARDNRRKEEALERLKISAGRLGFDIVPKEKG